MGNIIFEILLGHDYTIKKKTVKYYKNNNFVRKILTHGSKLIDNGLNLIHAINIVFEIMIIIVFLNVFSLKIY
jgi:hypothetical protein